MQCHTRSPGNDRNGGGRVIRGYLGEYIDFRNVHDIQVMEQVGFARGAYLYRHGSRSPRQVPLLQLDRHRCQVYSKLPCPGARSPPGLLEGMASDLCQSKMPPPTPIPPSPSPHQSSPPPSLQWELEEHIKLCPNMVVSDDRNVLVLNRSRLVNDDWPWYILTKQYNTVDCKVT